MMKKYLTELLLLMSVLACTKEADAPVLLNADGFEERELVPLNLYLGVDAPVYMVDGEVVDQAPAPTKAPGAFPYSATPGAGDNTVIYNLWILEFEQVGDQYVLNAQPTYVADYPSCFNGSGDAVKTIGVPASRRLCTLLFMANTGMPGMTFNPGTTLEQFKEARFAEIDSQVDLFGWDEDASLYAPRFNGTVSTYVNTSVNTIGTKASPIPLRRAMAVVDITVTNKSLRDPAIPMDKRIHLRHVRMNNVQNKSFYYTNYADYESSVTINRPSVAMPLSVLSDGYDWGMLTTRASDWAKMVGFGDWYDAGGHPISDPADAAEGAAAIAAGSAPTTAHARFYLPGNLRPNTPRDATSITLVGVYFKNGVEYDFSYDIPIQELRDGQYYYAVRPNHHYTYHIILDKLGDSAVDDYANDGTVDLSQQELANCYIVNPPMSEDFHTIYKVPVTKANLFWGDGRYEPGSKVEIYGSEQPAASSVGDQTALNMVISETDEWEAKILWADFDWMGKVELVDLYGLGAGKGVGANAGDQGCFGLSVAGGTKGNLVVAVLKTLSGNGHELKSIVWSWHFWITDYNPDAQITLTPDEYLYTVDGGKVFRLNNSIFNTGRYKKSYLMDRALGAWFNPIEEQYAEYSSGSDLPADVRNGSRLGIGLYYQFGRKDPFTLRGTYYDYQGNLHTDLDAAVSGTRWTKNHEDAMYRVTSPDVQKHRTLLWYSNVNYNDGYNYDQVAMTVMYPMIRPSTSNDQWTRNGVYKPLDTFNPNIFWHDPYFYERTAEDASNVLGYQKSIFDPCPPGWVLPCHGQPKSGGYEQILDNLNAKEGTYWKYWHPVTASGTQRGILVWPDGREIPNAEITAGMLKTAIFMAAAPNSQKGLPLGDIWAPDQCTFFLGYPTSLNSSGQFFHPYAQISGTGVAVQTGGRGIDGHQVRCVRNVKPE